MAPTTESERSVFPTQRSAKVRSTRRAEAAEKARLKAERRARRRPPLLVAGLLLAAAWATAATVLAVSSRREAERLAEEQADLRASFEDKIRALTRRLVGVASSTLLEQDGLTDRLADIISRQVQLETRQTALTQMAERLLGAGIGPRGGSPEGTAPPAPAAPPVPPADPRAPPDPRAPADPRASPPVPPQRRSWVDPGPGAPNRERFAGIEGSITRLEAGEIRILRAYARAAQGGTGAIRTAIQETGLTLVPPPGPPPPSPDPKAGSRRTLDPFESEVLQVEAAFRAVRGWRDLADTVPLRNPLEGGGLTSNFGTRRDPFTGVATMHAGMDFRSPLGTPIKATARGRVVTAGPTGGYGNLVVLDHGHDLATRYGHMSAIHVTVGQVVEPGTVVGLLGSTGRSTGPHLHYETRIAGSAVDPAKFIRSGIPVFGHAAAEDASPGSLDENEAPDD